MTSSLVSSSPPVLPIARQPSPLSFSSVSAREPPSPPTSNSSRLHTSSTITSSPSSSRLRAVTNDTPGLMGTVPLASPGYVPPARQTVPIGSLPDSLLLRSTFAALEHSATTLKRLSKTVLSALASYIALLEQLERAEDDVFAHLGELGRWLEGGYDVSGSSMWSDEGGIRTFKKKQRKREREEMEAMVEHGLRAIKVELKRNALAGGGAHARFENTAKQFYQQTSQYLSANHTSSAAGPSNSQQTVISAESSSTHGPGSTNQAVGPSSDVAQAARLAQFDLARYSYHSTLLYAVPPSSITCLDLLVSLYSWSGGLLGETPETRHSSDPGERAASLPRTGNEAWQVKGSILAGSTSVANTQAQGLKNTISLSLAHLAGIRSELLTSWAQRDQQTLELEDAAAVRLAENEETAPSSTPRHAHFTATPISASGIEHKKQGKMHRMQKSVGGRLREFLTSSSSTTGLSSIADRASQRSAGASFDGAGMMARASSSNPLASPTESAFTAKSPTSTATSAFPIRRPSSSSHRPGITSRHSMHASRPEGYISPFIASHAPGSPVFESSPDLRLLGKSPPPIEPSQERENGRMGGVGGLGAGGDEDERREEAGRKKEGVLWGAGVWEGLTKGTGKGKWENFWVVLDRSRIYEYRDNGLGKPESAHEVIDLKFASVREGRGTDRRFVFEVVTPTNGRRLYQATSEHEMKQWLYAICNAIESCINGTSSVRTFDTSKLRTVSGSLDDHALPTKRLLTGQTTPRVIGLGLPMPAMSSSPGGRRSMPPGTRHPVAPAMVPPRQRKTSFKKALRQSAEIASEKWSNVLNNRNSNGVPEFPRPLLGRSSSSRSSIPSGDGRASTAPEPSPGSAFSRDRSSFYGGDIDVDLEKRVLEMAGVGLGATPGLPDSPSRRVKSEGLRKVKESVDMTRTKSADNPIPPKTRPDEQVDMRMLRAIADLPENTKCADCGKGMKSSRWATISLREVPMVMFLCIRCCGIHRGLGTHISKPRSVDLDIWSPDSILLAKQWGNAKGNGIWESSRPLNYAPPEDNMAEYIRTKYVEGRWVGNEYRSALRLALPSAGDVGRAI